MARLPVSASGGGTLTHDPPVAARRWRIGAVAAWILLFALALIVIGVLVRPLPAGPVASDATASVLFFQRIVSGDRLEAFVNTTPKPLLTLVYGTLFGLTHDWRWISCLAVVVGAIAALLGARIAMLVAGPLAAALALALLVLSGDLLLETVWAFGGPWTIACWSVAALALMRSTPSYAGAGLALLLGALVRQETFLLIGVATVAATIAFLRTFDQRPLGLVLAWLALPVLLAHDLRLTGDPLYWLHVSGIYASGLHPPSAYEVLGTLASQTLGQPITLAAAVIGVAWCLRTPEGRVVAIGLLTIVLGISALLLAFAALGRQVLDHYYDLIAVAIGFGAAIGAAAAIRGAAARWRRPGSSPTAELLGVLVAGGLVGAIVLRPLLLDQTTLDLLRVQRTVAAHSNVAVGTIRSLLPEPPSVPAAPGPEQEADASRFSILVPRQLQTRIAAELGLPVTVVGQLVPASNMEPAVIKPGIIVVHDRLADPRTDLTKSFEGATATEVDGVPFEPVPNLPSGLWIWDSTP